MGMLYSSWSSFANANIDNNSITVLQFRFPFSLYVYVGMREPFPREVEIPFDTVPFFRVEFAAREDIQ